MPKKKKCLKGLSCGFACIKQSLWCAKELGPKPKAVLDKMVQLIGEPETVTYAPTLIKSLGKGEFGEVSLTDNGTAYKAFFPALPKSGYDQDGDWYDEDDEPLVRTNSAAEEVKIATELGKLGIGPQVLSIRRVYGETQGFEMGLLKDHRPLNELSDTAKYNFPKFLSTPEGEGALIAIAKLHSKGYFHGDLHGGNVLISSNGKAKLIDFGATGKIGEHPPGYMFEPSTITEYAKDKSHKQGSLGGKIFDYINQWSDKLYSDPSKEQIEDYKNGFQKILK